MKFPTEWTNNHVPNLEPNKDDHEKRMDTVHHMTHNDQNMVTNIDQRT